jgi:hypothetical protein
MVIERPEKSGSEHFARVEDHDLSMTVLVELAQFVLGKGRTVRLLAKGNSMTPFIRYGDDITLVPVSRGRGIGLGDVVGYIHQTPDGQRLVVHRVVGRRDSAPCSSRT